MGWKSTVEVPRNKAKRLIAELLMSLEHLSNEELANMMENLGYGDNPDLKYYGHNFIVIDTK